jgi:hypothetical protein
MTDRKKDMVFKKNIPVAPVPRRKLGLKNLRGKRKFRNLILKRLPDKKNRCNRH